MGTNRNTVARAMHDLGAAAWFGGSLMGSVGVNGAAADVRDPIESTRVAQSGWSRWTPVNLAAIGAHVTGSAMLLWANKGRTNAQKGVLAASVTKTVLTGAALGATAYTRILGEKVIRAGEVPSEGGTTPHQQTPEEVARAERQLHLLQWSVPALTGSVIIVSSYMSEQQRFTQVLSGIFARNFRQLGKTLAVGAVAAKVAAGARQAPKAVSSAEFTRWATRGGRDAARTGGRRAMEARTGRTA